MTLYQRFLRKPEFGSYEDFLHNFRINVPENFNFAYDVLDVIAEEEPDKRALQWAHMDGRERAFTFAEISRLSKQAANLFVRLGVQKGDKVMLVLRRHYTFWIAIMALCRIGAVAVPATHLLTKKDIVYRANCAGIKMVVTSAEGCFAASCEEALSECPTVEKLLIVDGEREGWLDFEALLAGESDEFPRPAEPLKHDDIMLLYFTSGTSGMPKMVGHNFDYPLGHIQTAVFWHQCVDGGLHLTVSETGWMKSVWGKLYGQWLAGSAIMVYDFEKFVPKDMLAVLEKYKVTTFCAPPTIYRFMILEDVSKYDLSSIQHCTTAGEPLNPEVFEKWKELTGHELREIFGQTELCVTVGTFPWMKVCPGSMGKPSPQFDVDIVDEDGKSCPAGQVGEIVVRTQYETPVGMFLGYYRDEEGTKAVWHDGMYHTRDLAWRDEWGYYWYVGRADDVIKSSGYRIGPFEIENVIMELPYVLECGVSAAPDEVRGQVVKASIVLVKGTEGTEELKKEIQNYVKQHTAPYKYPRIVEFKEELPKTISGKIIRSKL